MKCISIKLSMKLIQYFILITSLIKCSTFAMSTTVATSLSTNYSSNHEPICSNVKDLLLQRGIAEKDLPKTPLKGELTKS